MACPRCGCRMPARSRFGLVCADCGTPLAEEGLARPGHSWGSLVTVTCAVMVTTGAFVLSSLSSESPTLAESQQEHPLSDARADE